MSSTILLVQKHMTLPHDKWFRTKESFLLYPNNYKHQQLQFATGFIEYHHTQLLWKSVEFSLRVYMSTRFSLKNMWRDVAGTCKSSINILVGMKRK